MDKRPNRGLFDLDHPAFKPLWVRLLVSVGPLAWAAVEFRRGDPFWGTLFLAIGAFAAFHFLTRFNPRDEP